MTKLHAHFDGRVLIPDEPVDLPKGRKLEVQVREIDGSHDRTPNNSKATLPTFRVKRGARIIRTEDIRSAEDER